MRGFAAVVGGLVGFFATLALPVVAGAAAQPQLASQRSPLAILAPESPPLPETPPFLAELDRQSDLFAPQPTHEAAERLEALNRQHEERVHYQTESPSQALDYMHANRDLALWYLRSLARTRVNRFIRESRQYLREQKQRSESVPARSGNSAQHGLPNAQDQHTPVEVRNGSSICCSRILAQAWQFIERLTNDGVSASLEPINGTVRLNTQTTALTADLHSPIFDVNVSYRVRSPEHPMPFSGLSPDAQGERLVISGARSFPQLGLSGSVRYQAKSKNLNYSVAKTILGPVSGQLEQSRTLGGPGILVSSASLSMSIYF